MMNEPNFESEKKLEIQQKFYEWFEEIEGYSMRYERFWDDFDHAKDTKDNRSMVEWLRTAFEMGYYAGSQSHGEI